MMRPLFAAALALSFWGLGTASWAEELSAAASDAFSGLHRRIDSLVEGAAIGPLAPICADADFVRRVYLDLTGVIPTAEQARSFVSDGTSSKRERLIDELLESPEFLRHMTTTLDVMLMERKPEKVIKQPEWEGYLFQALAADYRLDRLFREMIAAETPGQSPRPAAKFVLDRDAEANLLTRDIGRLVFGMDLQCCQCHDHPLISDYYQDDYYGLFAFVHRTSLFTDAKTKLVSLTEKAEGEASFKSVFTGASSDKALPRLPKGAVLFVEPTFAKGQEYAVKPEKDVRGVPKFSRREALAEMLPASREFSRNLANRLWALVMGRGIVHPLDFHYAGNPPSNPRLLTLLADELTAGGFQLRPFLRELCRTRAYQRSCETPLPETINYADVDARLAQLQRIKAELTQAIEPHKSKLAQAKAAFKAARDEDTRLVGEVLALEKGVASARQSLEKLAAQRREKEAATRKIQEQAAVVAAAAAQLKAAAQTLAGEAVLNEAAHAIVDRSAVLNQVALAAAKSVSEPDPSQADTAEVLGSAEAALAATIAKRPTADALRQLEREQLAAQHQVSEASYCLAQCEDQIAAAKALLEYRGLVVKDPLKAQVAWTAVVESWTNRQQIAMLKPLTAEQLAASAMQATAVMAPVVAVVEAKLEKTPPEPIKIAAEADKPRLRLQYTQLELLTQLRGTITEFVRQYGGLPGEEFQATVNQALFFGNGNTIDAWLKPTPTNLVGRLAKLDDLQALADEMIWAVHSRAATEVERRAVRDYLQIRQDDRGAAVGEMVWALLSSSEFRFNH